MGGESFCSETVISSSILRSEGLFLVSLKARVRLDMSVTKIALEQRAQDCYWVPIVDEVYFCGCSLK